MGRSIWDKPKNVSVSTHQIVKTYPEEIAEYIGTAETVQQEI